METVYRDYRDKDVQFFYVYKSLAHPEVNNFISVHNTDERLMHIAYAKERFVTEIPWICDTLDNDVSRTFGNTSNGEFILDPDGKIVRKRFWSDPTKLRADLEELIGTVDKVTVTDDLSTGFQPEPSTIASGVVARLDLPRALGPLDVVPMRDDKNPHYAKLRVEATHMLFMRGSGQVYFGVYLDPIYKVHWDNRKGPVKIEFLNKEVVLSDSDIYVADPVEEDSDIDPRQFLIPLKVVDKLSPLNVRVSYSISDDANTFNKDVVQEYQVNLMYPSPSGGTRPGAFLNEQFFGVRDFDKNGDGDLTADELPPGKVAFYIGHLDYNGNQTIEKTEIDRFFKMFNNGRGVPEYNDGNKPR